MLWLLTFVASFHLRKRWTGFSVAALPWRGSGGGLPGPQPVRAALSPRRCCRMWCAGQGAQVCQRHRSRGLADLSWLVTWRCRDPWGWQTRLWKCLWILYVKWKDCNVVCIPTLHDSLHSRFDGKSVNILNQMYALVIRRNDITASQINADGNNTLRKI